MPKKGEEVVEAQTIPVDLNAFTEFILSLEEARIAIDESIQMGREFIGAVPPVEEEVVDSVGGEEGLDLNNMDETALLNLADEYGIEVPRKLTTADAIRDFLYDALQAGEVVEGEAVVEVEVEEEVGEEVVEEVAPPPVRAARTAPPARVAPVAKVPPAPVGRTKPAVSVPSSDVVRGKLKAAVRVRK